MDPMAQVLFSQIFNENGEYIWTSNDGFVVTMLDGGGGSITGVVDGQTVIVDMENVTTQVEIQLMNQYVPQAQEAFIQHQADVLGNNGYTTAESIAGLGIFIDSNDQPDMQTATIMSQLVAGVISAQEAMKAMTGDSGPNPLASVEAKVIELEGAISDLEGELANLRDQANADSEIITGHLNTIAGLNQRIQDMQTEAERLANEHRIAIENLETQVQTKQAEVTAANQAKASIESQRLSEYQQFTARIGTLESEAVAMQASLDSANNLAAQLQATIDNGDQAVAAINNAAQALLARLENLVAKARGLAATNNANAPLPNK